MITASWLDVLAKLPYLRPTAERATEIFDGSGWSEKDELHARQLYELIASALRGGISEHVLRGMLQSEIVFSWPEPLDRFLSSLPDTEHATIGAALKRVIPDVSQLGEILDSLDQEDGYDDTDG